MRHATNRFGPVGPEPPRLLEYDRVAVRPRPSSFPLEEGVPAPSLTSLPDPPHSMTVEQLATRWQVHPKTIQRHVRNGTFPIRPLLPEARALRFAVHAIEAHERSTTNAASSGLEPIPLS